MTTRTLGSFIKESISSQGMTQKDAAKQLHLSQQTLSSYIHDHRVPSVECFIDMIRLLGMDLSVLLYTSSNGSIYHKDIILFGLIRSLDDEGKDLFIGMLKYYLRTKPPTRDITHP